MGQEPGHRLASQLTDYVADNENLHGASPGGTGGIQARRAVGA